MAKLLDSIKSKINGFVQKFIAGDKVGVVACVETDKGSEAEPFDDWKLNGILVEIDKINMELINFNDKNGISSARYDQMIRDIDAINALMGFFSGRQIMLPKELRELESNIDGITEYFKRFNREFELQKDSKLDETIAKVDRISTFFGEFSDCNPFDFKYTEYVSLPEIF